MSHNNRLKPGAGLRLGLIATWAACLAALSIFTPTSVFAASSIYDYTVLAKSGDLVDGIVLNSISSPFLSDDGTVLFISDLSGMVSGTLLSIDSRGAGRLIAQSGDVIGGLTLFQFESAKRNDFGEIVFAATFNGGFGPALFRRHLKIVAPNDVVDEHTITFGPSNFDLNDHGEIVFSASYMADGGSALGIFTPHSVLVKTGSIINGVTLTFVGGVSLSKNGKIAFDGSYQNPDGSTVAGVFTQKRLVVKHGDTVDGLNLNFFSKPAVSESGSIGYEAASGYNSRVYVVDGHVIAKTGDVIDGFTLLPPGDPIAPLDGLSLNVNNEALFAIGAGDAAGKSVGGIFTQSHNVIASGDVIQGLTVLGVVSASINDGGDIVSLVVLSADGGTEDALILATPKQL